nr:T9SS type A sorting domain-containing protein [Saprospiraceae bacterium]
MITALVNASKMIICTEQVPFVDFIGKKLSWAAPLIAVVLFPCLATSQIEFSPLTHNDKVAEASKEKTAIYTHLFNSNSRSDSEPEVIHLAVPSGGSEMYCIDNPFLGEEFQSFENLNCAVPNFSNLGIENLCIEILANQIGAIETDTFCLRMTGTEGTVFEYIVIATIRPVRSLPFVDDFSYPGPFPDREYWLDRKVFVNQTFGVNPLSVGVATFDGLDENGAPYGGGFGASDVLTSAFINLNEAITDRCFITFYIQAGGNGYPPRVDDDLILEFRTGAGVWVEIARFEPDLYPAADSFYFQQIAVNPSFFFGDFQFRFINYNNGNGIASSWNLDYVKLANEFQADLRFENDIAFTQIPSSALQRYSAMPLNHFLGNEEQELSFEVDIHMYNHFNNRRQADPSQLTITEKESGQVALSETLLEVPPISDENQRDLDPGRHFFTNPIQNPGNFLNSAIDMGQMADKRLTFLTEYSFQQNEEQIPELERNNRVSRETVISNYFAYDDNSAELGVHILAGLGPLPSMAVQYHANVDDTLRGIAVNLPRVLPGDRNKRFKLMVWGASLEDPPLYESEELNPVFVDVYYDSIQGFSTYALKSELTGRDTAIHIPAGDFHIGWTQVSRTASGVYFGFDINSPEKTKYAYWNNGAIWQPMEEVVPQFRGAIMIRPVFGNEKQISTKINEVTPPPEILTLYPNPTRDFIYLPEDENSTGPREVSIFSLDGQLVKSLKTLNNEVDLSSLNSGTYLLRLYSKTGGIQFGKFIKH